MSDKNAEFAAALAALPEDDKEKVAALRKLWQVAWDMRLADGKTAVQGCHEWAALKEA